IILALDLGITANEEVDYANSLGIDILILDHHQPKEQLPNAKVIVDAHKSSDQYPFKDICTGALAYKLSYELYHQFKLDTNFIISLLGIVAFSTVADSMPLINENRTYVIEGLKQINNGSRICYQVLLNKYKNIDENILMMNINPMINAVGRLNNNIGFLIEFLISDDYQVVYKHFQFLLDNNQERIDLTKMYVEDLNQRMNNDYPIIIEKGNFNHGIIGLLASRLCMQYHKPVIIASCIDQNYSASARSYGDLDLLELLKNVNEDIIQIGGHKMACGMTIKGENFNHFNETLKKMDIHVDENIYFDFRLNVDTMKASYLEKWDVLSPFGKGLEKPLFGLVLNNYRVNTYGKVVKYVCNNIEIVDFNLDINTNNRPFKCLANISYNSFTKKHQFVIKNSSIKVIK
ncbi:MAG: DHHA1 domain-containing protein, partial [Erysipelotrichaceae bacterium]